MIWRVWAVRFNLRSSALWLIFNCLGSLVCGCLCVPQSTLVRGFALNCTRGSQAMPRRVEGAKIALLDFNLQKHRLQLGVQVRDPV